jgi:hypothetical protein
MIPQEKIAAVTRGLNEAFGVGAFDDIRDLTERPGSNRAYRIVVKESACLLRINTRPGDMSRHFQCMQTAADAGLAPRVWYTNAEDRISIADFVNAVPFPAADALRRVPAVLRALHALPPFPVAPFNTTCTFLLNNGPALDGFLQQFRVGSVLPEAERRDLLAHHERLAAVLSSLEPDRAPGHNDLFKPDNMLFDGSRLWLVDWEAAFQNDRYADLAVVANQLVRDEAEEHGFLIEYFGAPPSPYQAARFYLMRQLAHLFYAMAFLGPGSSRQPVDWKDPIPEYREFQRRFWDREAGLGDANSKIIYSRVHWEEFRRNVQQPRFKESLRIVANRHAA